MSAPAGSLKPVELWEMQLHDLLDAHPGRGGKTVVAAEIGISRQLLNLWLPMGTRGSPRQSPNYYNRMKIKAAWERIVKPQLASN